MDFVVHGSLPNEFDGEIRALGARILTCPAPSRPARYARRFLELLRREGPYDVVHSHLQHFGGPVVRLARHGRVPGRVVHAHNDTRPIDRMAGPVRRAYLAIASRWIRRHATAGVAVSGNAARSLFGPHWESDGRFRVVPCGIDLSPFRAPIDSNAIRASLGLATDAVVLGHVGRFHPQKNHRRLIEIAREALRRDDRARLLLVGDGELRETIEALARSLGLGDRVVFAGSRADVPSLIRAMDVFVFPSLYEGLGLVVVEAQAAGLPCVVSDAVPDEALAIPERVARMSLDLPASSWAEACLAAAGAPRDRNASAWRRLAGGPLDIATSAAALTDVYLGGR
jgi:glycosyltransferase involved in cell wall biosynthesis